MMRWFSCIAIMLIMTAADVIVAQTDSPSARAMAQLSWEPPPETELVNPPAATISKEIVAAIQVGRRTITLDKTKMADVQKHLGGTIGHRGDAGDSLAWLCFQGVGVNGSWVLWLESGEINGGTVGGFQWLRVGRDATPDKRCKRLQNSVSGVKLPHGLRPGMTEAEALKALGTPTIRQGDKLIFLHEHKESSQGQPYDSINTVTLVLRAGVVAAIEAWKTASS
jgi:hypothetical protein